MNRLLSLFVICLCQLAPFAQAAWAADNYFPLTQEQEDETKYTLTLNTIPAGAGSFNRNSGGAFSAGESVYMYYYANTDFVFEYWQSGDTIVSRDRYFYFTMPDHDATLTAVFRYDPGNPGNPDSPDQTKKYTLTLKTQPANAGSFNRSSGEQFAAGQSVYMYYYANTDYKFDSWQSGDSVVSRDRYFYFTMPEHDTELTAVYNYSPGNPANPDTAQVYYTVTLQTKPAGAGSFNWNTTTQRVAGSSGYVYAYANSDYVFREWQQDGKTVGTNQRYDFTMPAENMTLVAVYDYSPANPGNPGKNYWNEETGEVIVDDFTPGSLSSAVSNTIGGSSNRDKVQMMTIAGPINQSDWGVVNNYKNCTLLDLSRTYGMTYVPSYNFSGNTVLSSVVLPAGIEKIDYYAFRNCSSLSSISILAATPPTIGNRAFEGIADSIVYVPADAIALYQEADGWKDFTILPLATNVSSLEVNLPEGTNVATYKDMFIELVNAKSGQKLRYVVTNRLTYTFNSLVHRTSYNVYLRNRQGDVLGQVDGIDIVDQDVSVTFPSLMVPRDLMLRVLTPTGEDITGQTTITWFDYKDTYLTKGNTLTGQLEGVSVKYRVQLPQALAMLYQLPADATYEVQAANNLTLTLAVIPQTTIGGRVLDIKTGQPLNGATVAVSQMLNGLYSKSFTTKTDNKGQWSLQVYEAKTDITASMDDYVSKTQSFEAQEIVGGDLQSPTVIPDFQLKDISGTTIAINLTYQPTGGELQEYYTDYANVAYTVYNATAGKNVTELNVQYPQIVLMEQLPAGTVLRVTATSKNQKFIPVMATATVDSLDRASVTLPIVQLGGITASFRQTDNPSVVGILYDGNGRLLKKYEYASATLNINELQDGQYTLVTMAATQLFSTVGSLSQFAEAGLREGVDYVKNSITVRSGEMTTIDNPLIPFLDETKLYYTGDGTSISVNKSQITTGNYLTITGHIEFKSAYANQVSDVKLIVDLPEECAFVDNSVMRGTQTATYTYADNQVVVPLDYYGERVRFCFIPTVGGEFTATGSVQFTLNGKTITQPIGNAKFTVKDLSINLPSTVAKTTVPVSGAAPGKSSVEIYDDGMLIGSTTSLANGTWVTTCELNEPYNLSTHNIYAKVTTIAGMELVSETKQVVYDKSMVEPEKVTMLYYNPEYVGQYNIVFDLINGTVSPNHYYFFPYKSYPNWWGSGTEPKDFTFIADLSNNDSTAVNGVTIRVYTDNGYWRNLEAQYNTSMNRWVAVSQFLEEEAPVGVEVEIDAKSEMIADRDKIDEDLSVNNSMFTELEQEMDIVNNLLSTNLDEEIPVNSIALQNYLESDNYDASEVNNWILSVMYNQTSGDVITDEMADSLTIQYQKEFDVYLDKLRNSQDSSVYALLYLPNEMDQLVPTSEDVSFEHEGYRYEQKKWTPVSVEELLNDGFLYYNLTDSTQVFFKYVDSGLIIIDTKKALEYSMLPLDIAEGRSYAPYHASHAGFKQCVNDWSSLVANIAKYKNVESNLELKNVLFISNQFCGTVKGIIDASSCFYRGYLFEFNYRLENGYKKLIKEIEEKIEARRNLIDKHWERIKVQNDMISQQEDMIRQYQKNIDALYAQALNTSDPDILKELEKQIDYNENLIKASNEHIKLNKKIISDINTKDINPIEKQINRLAKEREGVEEGYRLAKKAASKIPSTLSKGKKVSVWTKLGKLAGPLGILCDVIDIYVTGWEAYDEIQEWLDLGNFMLRKLPCEGNPEEAESLSKDIANNFIGVVASYASILGTKAAATALNTVDVPVFTPHWWVASGLNIYAEWANLWASNHYITLRGDFWGRIYKLKCEKDKCPRCGKNPCECKDKCPRCGNRPCTCPNKCPRCGKNPCVCPPPPNTTDVDHDPSGYVYEGVASNRLQGVMASCYYKETVEDMYGDLHDNVVLWDAEEYAQQNPLFTDEYGMYRWDVPKGLWQVKFEKEGYQTTYSEWLPVPPPQLEVNIPMTQLLQPTVASAKAYSEGVEVTFDKYMKPETLTADHIIVTRNGEVADGTIELLNEEVAYEGQTQTYASKVRFTVPEDAPLLSTDEVILTVSKAVESYAGVQMQDTYTQAFDVEPRVTSIAADELINIGYGAERTIKVGALPAEASKGKTLTVTSLSTIIATVSAENLTTNEQGELVLTLDENGEAELTVTGELPGSTVLNYKVEDTDVEGQTSVNVKDAALLVTVAPRASRISGTEVYRGTEIRLTSETADAVIYYTLDGSCPCNTETALVYNPDEPIVIESDNVTIKAMAQGKDLAESEVAEFTYRLKKTNLAYSLPAGWLWISHNVESAVPTSTFEVSGVERIASQTQEVINDPVVGFVGNLNGLEPAVGYKVKTGSTGTVSLSGNEWNASKQPVPVAAGWNWIGYPVNQVMTLAEALTFFTPSEGDYIVGQDGYAEYASGSWNGTLEGMSPGKGYLYKSAVETDILFNTAIVSTANSRIGKHQILNGSPWAADKYAYPNIMPLTASLYEDGVKVSDDNYVVAAFADTECRGVGQWKDGRLMMSVCGEGGELLNFLAFDPQTEMVYSISETVEFGSDPVGSWNMPYMLTIGNQTVGIGKLYAGLSVTPRVAYDYVTVSIGGHDINRLTLTDMSGRTVASMAATGKEATVAISQLPEGIYIVTAVADGRSYYQKIVKSYK